MQHKFISYLLKHQIIFALFLICTGWLVIQIRDIIVSIFIAYIIMASLLPFVSFFKKKGFSKVISVVIPYVGLIAIILLIILPLVPFFIEQVQALITGLPIILNQITKSFGFNIDPRQIQTYFSSQANTIGQNAYNVTSTVFGGLFSMVTILTVSFYLLMYHERFKQWLARFFPAHLRNHVQTTLYQIEDKLGAWLRGQVILCFFIGTMSWIALSIIGLPNAIALSVMAGLLEILPTLGPILSSIPAIIVALTVSPTMAIIVAIIYVVIQFVENNLLVPKIMQRAVGLNPVVVILGIMIGANLMGIPGALLSIPFISFLIVLFNSINSKES